LTLLGKGVLKNAGAVSAKEAEKKALREYNKFRKEQDKNYISDFDQEVKRMLESRKKVEI